MHGVDEQGQSLALTGAEVNFSYRRTELPPRFVITRVDFELERGDREQLRARVAELKAKRAARQPRGLPNAGSIFKNPARQFRRDGCWRARDSRARGWGLRLFPTEHANFIVNLGGARAEEVRALIELARSRVKEQSGVALEAEVRTGR